MAIPSTSIQTPIPELASVLGRLGLTSYFAVLTDNGFRNWETVLDITEDDLTALQFKLGHRRALQREIATYRGMPSTLALESDNTPSDQPSLSPSALEHLARQTSTPPPREKRRYRRHPRPDSNAPRKPKTAYVNFADDLRTSPDISNLSFIDIAKEVGRRWQELPAEKKRVWESHAAQAMQEFEAQMDEYKKTENWRKYQVYLTDFKAQQAAATAPNGKRPNSSRTASFTRRDHSRASPSGSSDSPGSLLSYTSAGTEAEVCHNSLTLAFSELAPLRAEILVADVRPYDEQNLPPEASVRRAMYAFVRGTGSLLFMWTYQQVDEILDRIYRPRGAVDAMTLAECFIVAAMGAHYDMENFPDAVRRKLYASGSLHFDEKTARIDYMRTMRLLLATAFYSLLEKHMSARYLIAAGLQIARWQSPTRMNPNAAEPEGENWRRIFRSLIFMDCWLSYTLGYSSEVTSGDISIACIPYQPEPTAIDEQIYQQTSKVGLIAAEIAKVLASPETMTRENISMLADKLDAWHGALPPMLQTSTLTSPNTPHLTLYQKRAILMVHIMHLGAMVLLYRQLLIATAETQLTDGAPWNLNVSVDDAKRYRQQCTVAGQQIARILGLISFDGTLTKRCWLIIYWAFTASVVLLYSATTKLLEGQPEGVDDDLSFGKACMDMLEPCRDYEPIAARYLDTLWPLYDTLRDIHHRFVGRQKTSISSLIDVDPSQFSPPIPVSREEMGPVSEKLSILLNDPFGRRQSLPGDSMRRLLNEDGSFSVFWWK